MRTRSKLLLAALSATLLIVVTVGSASANALSLSNQRFRDVWSSLELRTGAGTVRCPVTLEGSYHSATLRKVAGALIGYMTRGTVVASACSGGRATVNQESLPWHLRYRGFRGTLPNITGVDQELIAAKWTAEIGGITCTAQTTAASPALGIVTLDESGQVTGLAADPNTGIPLRGTFFCGLAGNGRFAGTAAMTLLGNTSSIVFRLLTSEEPPPDDPRVDPTPVEFGRLEPEELARRTLTLTAGSSSLTVNSIRVTSGQYFAITDPNRCVGSRLAERGTCAFKVIFDSPREAGRAVEDTITVETSVRAIRVTARGST